MLIELGQVTQQTRLPVGLFAPERINGPLSKP